MIRISTDKSLLKIDTIHAFLKKSDWAFNRSREKIVKSIQNSLCFGAYAGDRQVGFARVITDASTFAYLCDVFVDEEFRGQGVSRMLMDEIVKHPDLQSLRRFCLVTKTTHGLYEKYGFKNAPEGLFMDRLNENA